MKKIITVIFIASLAAIACKSAPPPEPPPPPPPPPGLENPGVGPELAVAIPDLFSPDPDTEDNVIAIAIEVNHPVPIRDWSIQIQPNRGQNAQAGQRPAAEASERQTRRQSGQEPRRRIFFEQTGSGDLPQEWQWNGRGASGELVQSAMDYRFDLTVNDVFDNNTVYNGLISVDVLVRREGDILRIIVPSIVFPPNSADFSLLSDEDRRSNNRIMMLIARALNRFEDYRILVEGHANPTTKPNSRDRTNEEARELKPLSELRAKAVMDSLITNNNIESGRLSFTGIGGIRNVAAYNDEEENWKNRRVEFILQK